MWNTKTIALMLKGLAMGIAESIPGVSGGTIAFITGIYEKLLEAIKSITPRNIMMVRQGFGPFWKAIQGPFLLVLGVGMFIGLGLGVSIIAYLLENQQEALWALFFGIVLASIGYIGKDIGWDVKSILFAIAGGAISYWITTISPSGGSENALYVFLGAAVAISATMLPGISGGFILLLLGLYHTIILAFRDVISLNFNASSITLLIFAAGMLTGLFTFTRLVSYFFKNHYRLTIATMTGVLAGSLNKLWPWKVIDRVYEKSSGKILNINTTQLSSSDDYKIIQESNVSPETFARYSDPHYVYVIGAFILGLVLVLLLSRFSPKNKED